MVIFLLHELFPSRCCCYWNPNSYLFHGIFSDQRFFHIMTYFPINGLVKSGMVEGAIYLCDIHSLYPNENESSLEYATQLRWDRGSTLHDIDL